MGVIALPLLSPQGPIGPVFEWGLRSNTAVSRSPFTGATRTAERLGGPQFATLRYRNLHDSEAARLRSFLMQCRGMASRVYVPDFSYTQRGSFPATELFPNTTFSDTSGLSPSSETTLTVSNNILRATRTAVTTDQFTARASSPVTVVQYAPYSLRFIVHQGRGAYAAGLRTYDNSIPNVIGSTVTTFGRVDGVVVPISTSSTPALLDQAASALIAGDYFGVSFASFARCALVDNGANSLLHSDAPSNAAWTKIQSSASAVGGTAPDGVGDAEAIIENSATNFHYIEQSASRSSVAEDLCAFGYFKRRTGTRDVAVVVDDGAGNGGTCIFDLNAGIAGTPGASGTGTNVRAFIASAGSGWYYCAIVARCPASTSIRAQFLMNNAGSNNYTGDGASSIYAWRMGNTPASLPTRGMQTTVSGDADGTSQTGAALYIKGLPASTNGLLLTDDLVEIVTPGSSELKRVTTTLNSDAAGMGFLQFEPPLRQSPANNAAVLILKPLMRCLLDDNSVDWSVTQGSFTDLQFRVVEDVVPT